ncbi:MAG: phosphodiesterase [Deltaproteobacteria bacterium]|nr:phosphodiesterase [Deltaproteobacteria bacterium]
MAASHRFRLAVLGLDGLPLSLARDLHARGHLPNLGTLLHQPGCRAVKAELPELSPVNWTSMYTGLAPADHGVFGFTRIHPDRYTLHLTDFSQVTVPTLFDVLGTRGLTVKSVNLPNTWPARPIRGMMISGFPAPDWHRSVTPPPLAGILAARGYVLEADTVRGATDYEFLLSELHRTLKGRRAALDLLWPDLAWDLFIFVLTETDRLGHFLFPAMADPAHPMAEPILDLLQVWDNAVGSFLERFADLPDPKRLIVLADHGFTTLITEVDLNAWLRDRGLLAMPVQSGEWSAETMNSRTRAFALDPGRIYIHSAERFGRGALNRTDASRLAHDLAADLMDLTYEGRPVLDRILLRGRDIRGRFEAQAPDLICVPRPGFDLKGKFDRQEIFDRFGRTGVHTETDSFFYDSRGSQPERVSGIGREILSAFGASPEAASSLIFSR